MATNPTSGARVMAGRGRLEARWTSWTSPDLSPQMAKALHGDNATASIDEDRMTEKEAGPLPSASSLVSWPPDSASLVFTMWRHRSRQMASSWPLLAAAELDTCGFDSTTPYEKLVVRLLPVTKKLSTADLSFEGGEGHDVVE